MAKSIEEFLEQLDIVEVVGHYITLKRVGSNFMAPCPFHSETKPSFSVSPSRQIFHCFGCGIGGNAIKFVQEYENVSFLEAVKILSERYNIPIEFTMSSQKLEDIKKKESVWEKYYKAFEFLIGLFHLELLKNKEAMQYIVDKRKIPYEMIKKFKLGYIPRQKDLIARRIRENFKNIEVFLDIGIIGYDNGRYYDKLTGRIVFPIYNHLGKPVAIGARLIEGDGPKYINSPESPVFSKSKTFYALNFAKPAINREKKVIICEGYFDVIRLFEKGYEYSIATLGTAFTEEHLKFLKKWNVELYLIFDSDEAGVKAALRTANLLLKYDVSYKIVYLAENDDPDSFLLKYPSSLFDKAMENSVNIVNFLYKYFIKKYGDFNEEVENKFINILLPVLAQCMNAVKIENYLHQISSLTGISTHALNFELRKLRKKGLKSELEIKTDKKLITPEEKVLKECIVFILLESELAEIFKKVVDFNYLGNSIYSRIFKKLCEIEEHFYIDSIHSLMEKYSFSEEEKKVIYELSMVCDKYIAYEPYHIIKKGENVLKKLLELEIKKKIKELKKKYKVISEEKEKDKILLEMQYLVQSQKNIKEYIRKKLSEK